jgi:four helix bundle protein
MASVKCFEDLEIWKMAVELDKRIFKLTKTGNLAVDFDLRNALRKTSGSVMDNIAEGFEISGNKELIRFLYISKGSAGELRSQIHRTFHREYIDADLHKDLTTTCRILSDKIYNFIKYLEKSQMVGLKFNNRANANKSAT